MKNEVSQWLYNYFHWWPKPCRSLAVPLDWQIAHSKSLGAFFFGKMASNQTDHFQSLDSSVEEFIDVQENENTKKKSKHDVALFH